MWLLDVELCLVIRTRLARTVPATVRANTRRPRSDPAEHERQKPFEDDYDLLRAGERCVATHRSPVADNRTNHHGYMRLAIYKDDCLFFWKGGSRPGKASKNNRQRSYLNAILACPEWR